MHYRFLILLLACSVTANSYAEEPSAFSRFSQSFAGPNERSHRLVRQAFVEVVRDVNKSTVRVLSDDVQAALGTVVRSDGLIVTKASELGENIAVQLNSGRRLPATVLGIHEDYDVALLKVSQTRLVPIKWHPIPPPAVGSWLATSGMGAQPTAIGVVSAVPRNLPKSQAILGVGLERFDSGLIVNRVLPGSGAEKAGVRRGDVLVQVNGSTVEEPLSVTETIRQMSPGERVALSIRRGERSMSIRATLGDIAHMGNFEQAELMDSLGGPLSARRSGFPVVLQHDTVLRPRDCGGPVVDLDGRVVGINIARASRVGSYALPASAVRGLLPDMIAGKYAPERRDRSSQQEVSAGG